MRATMRKKRRFIWRSINYYLLRYLCSLLGAYALSRPIALSCIAQAYEFRGYDAVGGEWILISAIFVTTAYCISRGYLLLCHRLSTANPAAERVHTCRKLRGTH